MDPEYWVGENDVRKSIRYSYVERPNSQIGNGASVGVLDDRWSLDDTDPLGLKKIHKDTSYNDLLAGAERLRYTLDQKSEALRNLVQDNFDRFVSAKNTIDTVYGEMKTQSLNVDNDYGVRGLDNALFEAINRAEQVFGPVLINRNKAEKIRSTLSVLEKYKFFFNLPSSLMESIKQQNYDVIIRDYKKGKVVLESTMSSDTSENNGSSNPSTEREVDDTALSAQYRKVFDKVWAEIEKIMEEMREQLFKQLTEPWRSMEEQERTINVLLELDTLEDPIWHYLDSQYKFIIDLLKESYQEQLNKIQALKKSLPVSSGDTKELALRLKNAIRAINIRDYDSLIAGKDMDVQIWKATLDVVKSLSDLLLRCLPDFWKLSKSFMEGKFQKSPAILSANRRRRQAMDLRKVEQCQNMAKGVIDLYASLLSEFFSLPPLSASQDSAHQTSSFIPLQSDSVTTCYFLTKILNGMSECVNDINSINMASDVSYALQRLMEQTRWKFVEIICEAWNSDAKIFYLLEDWSLDQDNREITNFLRNFHIFHKYNSRSAYKIASLGYVSDDDDNKSSRISDAYLQKIKGAFLDSLYAYLDGLVHLVFSEYTPLESCDKEPTEIIQKFKIDPKQIDSRILLTISNLVNLKQLMIPRIVSQFETAYQCSLADDTHTLNDVINQLDGILFEDYMKRRTQNIRDIVVKGILSGDVDWYNISKPTEVHSFVYEALLSLVIVHAQVNDIAKHLVNRTLTALLENMARDCLEAFQKVEKFGMGGMLQATLEIEFMHQTLSQYVSKEAQETLQLIYTTIEQLYDTTQATGNLDSELSSVKQLLVESRKNTSLQFLCFKKLK
ncbi:23855_t:CDS:10 [Cetraspora pellucida]|uniref:Exocyst complex component SEC5 n=1 Tax=Cetraspora pellucida TaxID=1433469 RepID=A0A9N9AHJ7_9GLOM|nr:23855_t:CDS:10 [Cetraspora pellucida]